MMPGSMTIEELAVENNRLRKMVDALMDRVEYGESSESTAYEVFQSTVMLENLVRLRTHELEAALERNEKISRELQHANEKLEQGEKSFRNIVDNAPIGMSVMDTTYHFILVNRAFCNIVGYTGDELKNLTPLTLTHPDDLALSLDNFERLITDDVGSYQIEKRYIRKDGEVVWVQLTTSLLRDAQGKPVNFVAQMQDITERRRSEEKLRLAATIYNCSHEAMMITDAQNRIVATNPAFTALTGYSADEVLGANPSVLSSGSQDKQFYQDMWKTLAERFYWEGDVWNRKKNGEVYAEWLSISAVQNDEGQVQNYVALFTDITEQKQSADLIWKHANYDALTQLPNRRLFRDRLEQGMKKAERNGDVLALLFIDLDHFKEVNDTLGHQSGDDLLVQVANRITAEVRASDTVARLGGDEFTVILTDLADASRIDRVAQALVDSLVKPFMLGNQEVRVSASIGIIVYPDDAKDVHSLLKGADKAMYRSKSEGRNRFSYFGRQE
jgi:diguanylate cyclase (GGDEF)-like protein/PAS domain S-box-containing protein